MNSFEGIYRDASDAELMQQFYDGDNRAFDALAQRVKSSLYHQAYHRLPSRLVGRQQVAEDLVQQALVKAVLTRDKPATRWQLAKGKVRTWLGTILRNVLISYLRTRVSKQLVCTDMAYENDAATYQRPETEIADHRLASEHAARDTERRCRDLLLAIEQLPGKVRRILDLKREGLSHREIAKRLGLSKSTISYHFREASQTLREMAAVAA